MPRVFILCLLVGVGLLGACSERIYFFERTKTAIALEVGSDPAEPVQATVGYKRSVVAIVPPKKNGEEAQSLISNFEAGYASSNVYVRNGFATGTAAGILASSTEAMARLYETDFTETREGQVLEAWYQESDDHEAKLLALIDQIEQEDGVRLGLAQLLYGAGPRFDAYRAYVVRKLEVPVAD